MHPTPCHPSNNRFICWSLSGIYTHRQAQLYTCKTPIGVCWHRHGSRNHCLLIIPPSKTHCCQRSPLHRLPNSRHMQPRVAESHQYPTRLSSWQLWPSACECQAIFSTSWPNQDWNPQLLRGPTSRACWKTSAALDLYHTNSPLWCAATARRSKAATKASHAADTHRRRYTKSLSTHTNTPSPGQIIAMCLHHERHACSCLARIHKPPCYGQAKQDRRCTKEAHSPTPHCTAGLMSSVSTSRTTWVTTATRQLHTQQTTLPAPSQAEGGVSNKLTPRQPQTFNPDAFRATAAAAGGCFFSWVLHMHRMCLMHGKGVSSLPRKETQTQHTTIMQMLKTQAAAPYICLINRAGTCPATPTHSLTYATRTPTHKTHNLHRQSKPPPASYNYMH